MKSLKSWLRLTHRSEHLVSPSIEPGLALEEAIRTPVFFIFDGSILSPCHRIGYAK